MARIICIHSFRGGTGKSNITANLAACLTLMGRRVGVIDADLPSPGIHILFRLGEDNIQHSLNDYLWRRCDLHEAAHDVTIQVGVDVPGQLHLIPSILKAPEIGKIVSEGYDISRLTGGYRDLVRQLDLDLLLIDTHPGLSGEALQSIVGSDLLLQVMRPDQQDFRGTAVALEAIRKLNVPSVELLINKVPGSLTGGYLREKVESAYDIPVGAILPLSEQMVQLGSAGLFCLKYPDHLWTAGIKELADRWAHGALFGA